MPVIILMTESKLQLVPIHESELRAAFVIAKLVKTREVATRGEQPSASAAGVATTAPPTTKISAIDLIGFDVRKAAVRRLKVRARIVVECDELR